MRNPSSARSAASIDSSRMDPSTNGSRPSLDAGGGPTVVLGAGPAGLTFEAVDVVGGIALTVAHDGCRLDLGGHRFFGKLSAGPRRVRRP